MSSEFVIYKIRSSDEALQDAVVLINAKRWNAAISRLYYAAFHMVSALLLTNGYRAKTHSGMKNLFLEQFVLKGSVSAEEVAIYVRLYNWRNDADYGDFMDFNEEATLQAREELVKFLEQLTKLLEDKGFTNRD